MAQAVHKHTSPLIRKLDSIALRMHASINECSVSMLFSHGGRPLHTGVYKNYADRSGLPAKVLHRAVDERKEIARRPVFQSDSGRAGCQAYLLLENRFGNQRVDAFDAID